MSASTIPSTVAAYTYKTPRSFGAWVRFLKHDGVLGLAFAVGLLSALGFLLMTWPVVFDACATIVELFHRGSPKRHSGSPQPYTTVAPASTPDHKLQ
ncbi:hypothetical protein WJX74_006150 [Apatococcus lobatus]|uniref:Uncharacterized protein n=2 Tax=Apatococcus TaxID=904362 RepID=A0AAW1SUY9_9CHLO